MWLLLFSLLSDLFILPDMTEKILTGTLASIQTNQRSFEHEELGDTSIYM